MAYWEQFFVTMIGAAIGTILYYTGAALYRNRTKKE